MTGDRTGQEILTITPDFATLTNHTRAEVNAMENAINLSLEQKFTLRSFEDQVGKLDGEQARHFLVELYRQMMVRENFYKEFIRQEWNGESVQMPGVQMP